jgi:negative regulator of flagellin synthesis FlgM
MKITPGDEISKYINETAASPTKKPAEKASEPARESPQAKEDAVVSLSQRLKEVQKAQETIRAQADVRLERIQAIKEKVENRTYEIDYDRTAEKLLKAFSDEIT